MILLVDHLDSYTYNLKNLLSFFDIVEVIRVDQLTNLSWEPYNAIVYSPGPGTPTSYPNSLALLRTFYHKKPFFGVCLGMQMLGALFDIPVQKASQPMHGKTTLIYHSHNSIFQNLPNPLRVMRYHSLLLPKVKSPLQCLAKSEKGEIMAIGDESAQAFGVQFHPESILTEYGKELLANWVRTWK